MAVQAHHSANNLFHSSYQFLLANRDFLKINQETANAMINHETLPIHHHSQNIFSEAMNIQSESGLTYNAPRKRQRDQETTANNDMNIFTASNAHKLTKLSSAGNDQSFLENDTAFQIHGHQCDVDQFLANHTERVREELEKQRKREARTVVRAFEERIRKRLREKDEEITNIGKLNWALQERVKTLCVENQLWRELAQSNEAAAASLRSNLHRVLLSNDNDAESCCGENDTESGVVFGACKWCGEEEARVLVLPCRHLCLCAPCGSHLTNCPVCHSILTASVRVNFS